MLPDVIKRIYQVIEDDAKAKAIIDILREAEQQEKEMRAQKQQNGIIAARERGVQFGRPQMALPDNFSNIYCEQQDGNLTVIEASRVLNVSRQQYYRLRKRYQGHGEE